jgi:hypothetical protein
MTLLTLRMCNEGRMLMPITIDQFEEVNPSVFEQYPAKKGPGQGDPAWDDLLTRLERGKVVRLPYSDESQLRGLRLAVGRRAAGRGFKVETRHDGQSIVIRRRDQATTAGASAASAGGGAKRGRRRKQDDVPEAIQDGLSETME